MHMQVYVGSKNIANSGFYGRYISDLFIYFIHVKCLNAQMLITSSSVIRFYFYC